MKQEMKKKPTKSTHKTDESSDSSSYDSSSSEEDDFVSDNFKSLPAAVRLRLSIQSKKDERMKGFKKDKENFDE